MGAVRKDMSTATHISTNLVPVRRTGRKMRPGKWVHDPYTGVSGIFTGYCPNCEFKIVKRTDDIAELQRMFRKDQKTLVVRIIKHLLAVKNV